MLNILLYLFYIGSGEPYVHEFKEFAGVTIILRSTPNPKGFGNYDGHGKTGMQAIRRKSEYQHPQSNTQDKFEHGDKTDHTGILFLFKNNRKKISSSRSQRVTITLNIIDLDETRKSLKE